MERSVCKYSTRSPTHFWQHRISYMGASYVDESCGSIYVLWSILYPLSRFCYSLICPNPPLVVITLQSIASNMIRKSSYSRVITPLLAPPVQDEDRHPPSSSLSLVFPYVLLSSRVSRCRVSILWNSSFRLRRRFRRLRQRS